MDRWFFLVSVVGAGFTVNAFLPRRGRLLLLPSFFAGWLTLELAHWHILWQAVATVLFIAAGALDSWLGWLALAITLASWAGLVFHTIQARRTVVTVREAIADLDVDDEAPPFPRSHVLFPVLMFRRRGARRIRNVQYAEVGGRRLRLDVYVPEQPGERRPVVMQIHGGGWVVGDKREQGVPLLNHLAASGWVGFNVNYRLSPRVAFPDHLIDLKRALAWIREHAADYGGDPDFVCVTGGSAGGHLTALMALTAKDPAYQPGFEEADTSVCAAVPFYGVYDFTNRLETQTKEFLPRFVEPIVMKKKLADDPEAFARASPIDCVRPDAPPFFVIHGSIDTLAPTDDARLFVERLREVSDSPVVYAEMPGAQHAFDIFPSFRTASVIEGVERFLTHVHQAWLSGREGAEVSDEEMAEVVTEDDDIERAR